MINKEYFSKEKTFDRAVQDFIEIDINLNNKADDDILRTFEDDELDRLMPVINYYFRKGLLIGIEFCNFLKSN